MQGEYFQQVDCLRKIRDIAKVSDDLRLPQICVVGATSAGKSSFLSRLTGIPFPQAAEMCTICAIVVNCTCNEDLEENKFEIHNGTDYEVIEAQHVARKIEARQAELLQKAAEANGGARSKKMIVKEEIKVQVQGPKQTTITLVDLPGFIQNENPDVHARGLKQMILDLVKSYVAKKETLICVVSKADEALENVEGFQVARDCDKLQERTIHILSKFDTFDSNAAKMTAINRVDDGQNLELGPHAIINRTFGSEECLSPESETNMLREMSLPFDRCGATAFNERAQPLFGKLLSKNIPALREILKAKLGQSRDELERLGRIDRNERDLMNTVKSVLDLSQKEFRESLSTKAFQKFEEAVSQTEKSLTLEKVTKSFGNDLFKCPHFQGADTFDEGVKMIVELWTPLLDTYMKSALGQMMDSVGGVMKQAASKQGIPSPLVTAVIHEFKKFCTSHEIEGEFKSDCKTMLQREGKFGTVNRYFEESIVSNETLPEELVKDFEQRMNVAFSTGQPPIPEILKMLATANESYAKKKAQKDMTAHTKDRIFKAVMAHWRTERKTFVDNIFKVSNDTLVQGRKDWLNNRIQDNVNIRRAASEEPRVKRRREALLQQEGRYHECLAMLEDLLGEQEDEKEGAEPNAKRAKTAGA